LKKVLSSKEYSTNVGDEGGFAPSLKSHEEAMDCISEAIEKAGYKLGTEISFSLDSAASEFYNKEEKTYTIGGKDLSTDEMIEYYANLVEKYPIYSIEDGLDESDHAGWTKLTEKLGDKVGL